MNIRICKTGLIKKDKIMRNAFDEFYDSAAQNMANDCVKFVADNGMLVGTGKQIVLPRINLDEIAKEVEKKKKSFGIKNVEFENWKAGRILVMTRGDDYILFEHPYILANKLFYVGTIDCGTAVDDSEEIYFDANGNRVPYVNKTVISGLPPIKFKNTSWGLPLRPGETEVIKNPGRKSHTIKDANGVEWTHIGPDFCDKKSITMTITVDGETIQQKISPCNKEQFRKAVIAFEKNVAQKFGEKIKLLGFLHTGVIYNDEFDGYRYDENEKPRFSPKGTCSVFKSRIAIGHQKLIDDADIICRSVYQSQTDVAKGPHELVFQLSLDAYGEMDWAVEATEPCIQRYKKMEFFERKK